MPSSTTDAFLLHERLFSFPHKQVIRSVCQKSLLEFHQENRCPLTGWLATLGSQLQAGGLQSSFTLSSTYPGFRKRVKRIIDGNWSGGGALVKWTAVGGIFTLRFSDFLQSRFVFLLTFTQDCNLEQVCVTAHDFFNSFCRCSGKFLFWSSQKLSVVNPYLDNWCQIFFILLSWRCGYILINVWGLQIFFSVPVNVLFMNSPDIF